jgi:hypothetical protein
MRLRFTRGQIRHQYRRPGHSGTHAGLLPCILMADVDVLRNADAPWKEFSSNDYWRRNYSDLHAEDREIIRRVSDFLICAFAERPPAERAIDVGSGTNLYPALLMLPWTERILLADYSESNVGWLQDQLADDTDPWPWLPFWCEIQEAKGYSYVDKPRARLREACVSEPGYSGVERFSIFDLPEARWDVGTMFFVAESITEDAVEFRAAVAAFVGGIPGGRYPLSGPADCSRRRQAASHRAWRARAERGTARYRARSTRRLQGNDRGHRLRQQPGIRPRKLRPESDGDTDTAAHPGNLACDR